MKKLIAILMTLCLLCAAGASLADMEIPTFDSMPPVVVEDEETTVDEAAFAGEWVLNVAFYNTEYVDEQTLAGTFGYNFMPWVIGDGKITQEVQQENGEFITAEMAYVFEAGQLQSVDDDGLEYAFELLEDGNIVMSVFIPGEGEAKNCLSVYMVHPAE